ncbi:putative transcription elongation factor SPT5 homolog 1 isoform X2 [Hevea brasiliensis]|uniref:putative transcription elongation factor SPT5 homolog 1 isoform X2 n=1 Tax=Hevea brasiliensis TaxID=3981 RepID=UPI0025D3D4A0|nr:putative transcription elongation factor SPT5 homolog 1 isoform X2 [Hevea brasiliensis]
MLDDDDEEEGGGSSRKRVRSSFIDDEAVVDSDDEEEEEDDAEDDVDNVQRGVRVTLIPQIDSQAIANKLDGGEEVKKVAFVPPCFVNGDEARKLLQ